jgi:hypothetical protein
LPKSDDLLRILEDDTPPKDPSKTTPSTDEIIDNYAKVLAGKLEHGMKAEEIEEFIADHLKDLDQTSKIRVLVKALAIKTSLPK